MIVIVDYGMGNLRSVQSKLQMIHFESIVSADPSKIVNATKLILPGVGHFGAGMKNINDRNLIPSLNEAVLVKKVPILGICLGMQLLATSSEEGNVKGLGWLKGEVKRFPVSNLPVPHVGWNTVKRTGSECLLYRDLPEQKAYYFTHSYFWKNEDETVKKGVTDYVTEFVSVVQKENIYGTQFHPEKSRLNGFKMIENFLRYS